MMVPNFWKMNKSNAKLAKGFHDVNLDGSDDSSLKKNKGKKNKKPKKRTKTPRR